MLQVQDPYKYKLKVLKATIVFMITKLQQIELEKVKPPKYREKVQVYLSNNGHNFSLETIQKVYSGKRNNLTIAKAIVTVFSNYMEEQEFLKNKLNTIIKQIKDTP